MIEKNVIEKNFLQKKVRLVKSDGFVIWGRVTGCYNNGIMWEILNAIKGNEENEKLFDAPEEINFKDICLSIGWEYDGKKAQRLGYIFNKKLLLKTKRKTQGTVLILSEPKNDRRLKYLYRRHKV